MSDEQTDLSAPSTNVEDAKSEVQVTQFKRDLSHILIHATSTEETPKGPQITVGPYVLQFKEKTPVSALSALISGEDRVAAMRDYITQSIEGDTAHFEELLKQIDLEGLGEIIGAVSEGYTSFPAKS